MNHCCYFAAKAGDAESALLLATDLVSADTTTELRKLIGQRAVVLLPVIADETTGFNAIPDALAQVLSSLLAIEVVVGEIVQTNKVGHTRAPAFQRLVTPASFDGPVEEGRNYVLVDDHVGLGGTLANLRGYVEARGGLVIAMTTLTESREARQISLRSETRTMLYDRHGDQLDQFWRDQFGYGTDCLTEVEAINLCRQPSVVAIQNFLAQTAIEARRRGLETALSRSDQ